MADDLDELLDEVENKFCRLSRRDCSERGRPGQGRKRNRFREEEEEAEAEAAAAGERARFSKVLTKGASEEEDIDDIIKDIIDENSYAKNLVKHKSKSPSPASENRTTSIQAHGKRCCPVYLGGSSAPHGIGTNISQRKEHTVSCCFILNQTVGPSGIVLSTRTGSNPLAFQTEAFLSPSWRWLGLNLGAFAPSVTLSTPTQAAAHSYLSLWSGSHKESV
uniref:protein C8orf37 homolog isoform X2 n=1 Tax=Podarcis muralis TaxID=64176 RepID=UPI0010A062DD|nr:protein C8orf37 homolog isoform X2 [Podarcis muralis]